MAIVGHRKPQQVNQACKKLYDQGKTLRLSNPKGGHLINRWKGDATQDQLDAMVEDLCPYIRVSTVTLKGVDGLPKYAYTGKAEISEDDVKLAVHAALRMAGWRVTVQWGRARGIDIEATCGQQRLVLEAKGEGSTPQVLNNNFVSALGELVQAMESPTSKYGLALPAHEKYVRLIQELPRWGCERLALCFYLVRGQGDHNGDEGLVGYEVAHIQTF